MNAIIGGCVVNKKSGISIVVLLVCMAAIILFGQKRLFHVDVEAENSKGQEMYLAEKSEGLENTKKPSMIDADIYTKDLELWLAEKNTTGSEDGESLSVTAIGDLEDGQADSEQQENEQPESERGEGETKSDGQATKETTRADEQSVEEITNTDGQVAEEAQKNREEEALEAVSIKNPKITVSAKAAVLMKAASKEILFSKHALDEIQPASTAKLLTAIVAVELSGKKEKFTVGSEIQLIASDSSRAYLVQGQVLSLEQILDALLLPSGNDAAYVIAANLGRKLAGDDSLKAKAAVKRFLQKMNETADEIGVVHSNFLSPDGYDANGQYTTAYDMALIASKALKYDEILGTVKKAKARHILLSGEDVTWYNSNKLIKEGSGYYYKYAIGLKTGSSGEAGRCLISAAKKDEEVYISVVMDASYDGRWQDSMDLLRYGIEQDKK